MVRQIPNKPSKKCQGVLPLELYTERYFYEKIIPKMKLERCTLSQKLILMKTDLIIYKLTLYPQNISKI